MAILLSSALMMTDPYRNYGSYSRVNNTPSFKADLPLWQVGKSKIYAKNQKDAIKYAKKRGLWDGSEPIKIG